MNWSARYERGGLAKAHDAWRDTDILVGNEEHVEAGQTLMHVET